MTDEREPIEHELIRQGALFEDLETIETSIVPTVGDDDLHVRIELRVDAELVESCAFGLMFVLLACSFGDARPRGFSGSWYEDEDRLTVGDMLRHMRFEDGRLHLYVDYLRGRCVKTRIDVTKDGKVTLETVNRGQAATRWVDRLRGRSFLRPVESS